MRISNACWAAFGLLTGSLLLQADTATFATAEGKLSGTLQAISKEGIIEWESPYSKTPLKLRAEKLEQIELSGSPGNTKTQPIQLTLRNGDILPVSLVTGLEEDTMLAQTSIAGMLDVPRAALSSAQFGITQRKVIYEGIDNIRQWTTNIGEPDNWKRRGNSLVSSGSSIAASDFDLPQNFSISFNLSWEGSSPNFSLSFADPLVKDPKKQDLYRYDFDNSGMRILRHQLGDTRAQTLAQWKRQPSSFSNKSMNVEIRVDRDKRQIELLIDGETEGVVLDVMKDKLPVPSGTGITIECETRSGSSQTIDALTITELNDSRTRHLEEQRGDASLDCIITTDDDRWSGHLVSLSSEGENRLLQFKPNFSEESWEIPENDVSTVFFANNPFKGGPGGEPKYLIEFHGKGKLSTVDCQISGDILEATHPLLGPLQIQRQAVKTIRRIHKKG